MIKMNEAICRPADLEAAIFQGTLPYVVQYSRYLSTVILVRYSNKNLVGDYFRLLSF